jgi:EmrB/QacA subfamily drug resistance transporter
VQLTDGRSDRKVKQMDAIYQSGSTGSRIQRLRWWTLAVLSVTIVIAAIDETILNVAIPSLQRDLEASSSALQWMLNSYMIVFGGALLTMGGMGDRFGRAKFLRIGLVTFGLASVAAALSETPTQLIIARAFMGLGGAMMMPATLSIIVNVFNDDEKAKAIGIWAAMAGAGIALGPILGGVLLQNFYWGSVFLINVPITGVAVLASLFLVPDSRDPNSRPLDIPGALLSTGAVSSLILAIIEGPAWGIASSELWITVVATVIFGTGFVIRERTTEYPLVDFSLFKLPQFSTGIAAVGLAFFAMVGFIFGLTQYLQFVQGHDPMSAGLRFLPSALGVVMGAIGSEQLATKLGTRKLVISGLVILSGVLPVVLLWEPDSSYWIIGPVLFAVGLGTGAVFATAAEAVMGAVTEAKAGVGSAMSDVAQMVAGALSIAVVGTTLFEIYNSRLNDAVSSLPAGVSEAARDSIGAALDAASRLPEAQGLALQTAAKTAFTDAMGISVILGAGLSLVGVLLLAKFMPETVPHGHGAHGAGSDHNAHHGQDHSHEGELAHAPDLAD